MNELMVEMLVEQEAPKLEMLVDLRGDSLYTIWLGLGNEGTKADFLVWLQGKTPVIGENGNWFIAGIDTGVKAQGNDGYTPQKGVDYFDGQDGYTPQKGVDYNDGDKGEPFTYADFTPEQIEALKIKGDTGVGIDYISLTSTNGKVKTYTITFDDLRTTTFDVTDGADGHSPVITFVGTTIYVDGVAGVDLKGEKGDKGDKGDTGDAFVYDDFTPEQIAELQQPATTAAGELTETVNNKMSDVDNAEGLRATAETTRQGNEATRVQAESDRNAAELLRLSAETTRVQNEQGRVTAEGLRVTAEQARQAAGYITSPSAMQIVQLTQAQYDALNPKIATTIYLIIQA